MHTFELARQHAAIGPLRDLVRRLVIPHFTLFGWIIFLARAAHRDPAPDRLPHTHRRLAGLALSLVIVLFLGHAPHSWRFGLVLLVAWHVVLLATPCARRLSFDDRLGRDP